MLKQEELNSIKPMKYLCALEIDVTINGKYLDSSDFGEQEDLNRFEAEPYGCGDMQFIPYKEVNKDTLEKYNITEEEYRMIQDKLDCLSFGRCGYCI